MSLPTPVGRQREVLYYRHAGHIVVLGTAGSGKTTLAIHRAKYLGDTAPNKGRTLLVTFNKMLVTYLDALAPEGMPNVDVHNYHQFARGYLSHRGVLGRFDIIPPGTRDDVIVAAVEEERQKSPGVRILQRDPGVLSDEIEWVARMGITRESEYLSAARVERAGVRIARAERPAVWKLYETYRRIRLERGYKFDWDDLALAAADEFGRDTSERVYKHVVIDEGQDFSPVMLRSLAAAIPTDGTVTFFGDVAQQIYGARVSWRHAGLQVGTNGIVHFQENYRNTRQIAAFALSLANGPFFTGTADMVEPRAPKAEGAPPVLVECRSTAAEREFIVQTAARLGRNRSVAILLRDRRTHEGAYLSALRQKKVVVEQLHRDTQVWTAGPRVWVGTYHAAKGLEFDAVLLPHLDDSSLPDEGRVNMMGDATDVCREDAKLLYVAITRARADLLMTYSGKLTRLLGAVDPTLYQRGKP